MLKCKQREVMPGDINIIPGTKMGLFTTSHVFLPDARKRRIQPTKLSRLNASELPLKLISGCIKQFRPSAIIKSNFCPEHNNSSGVGGVKIAEAFPKAGTAGGGGDWPPPARSLPIQFIWRGTLRERNPLLKPNKPPQAKSLSFPATVTAEPNEVRIGLGKAFLHRR